MGAEAMTSHDHPDTDLNDPHGEAEALRKENARLRMSAENWRKNYLALEAAEAARNAAQDAEPVAWRRRNTLGVAQGWEYSTNRQDDTDLPLYAHLSDAESLRAEVERLTAERDEADRRAGASERALATMGTELTAAWHRIEASETNAGGDMTSSGIDRAVIAKLRNGLINSLSSDGKRVMMDREKSRGLMLVAADRLEMAITDRDTWKSDAISHQSQLRAAEAARDAALARIADLEAQLAALTPPPDAELDALDSIGRIAVGHLREMYRPAYDALGPSGRTSLRNLINSRVAALTSSSDAEPDALAIWNLANSRDPDDPVYVAAITALRAKAEVERRVEMHECAMQERDDAILHWVETNEKFEKASAEIARLTAERDALNEELREARMQAIADGVQFQLDMEDLTAERDEARAQVAMAYEVAAQVMDTHGDSAARNALGQQLCCSGQMCRCQGVDVGSLLQYLIRSLTPADAAAAIARRDAAMRNEGRRQAAAECGAKAALWAENVATTDLSYGGYKCRDAILAALEPEGGE